MYVLRGTHPTNSSLNFEEQYATKVEVKTAIGNRLASPDGWYLPALSVGQIVENSIVIVTILNNP